MSEHVTRLLYAYYDRELDERQIHRVQAHLEKCASCRQELKRIQALSQLLSETPLPERMSAPDRFKTQVGLLLPRRKPQPSQQAWRILQRAVPYGLVGLWGLIQAVFAVAFGLQLLLDSSLIPQLTGLLPAPQITFWSTLLNAGASPNLLEVLNLLLSGITLSDPYLFGAAAYLVVHIVLAVLFGAWLAGWYLSQRHAQLSPVTAD